MGENIESKEKETTVQKIGFYIFVIGMIGFFIGVFHIAGFLWALFGISGKSRFASEY